MKITKHAKSRLVHRVCSNKKKFNSLTNKAYREGITHKESKGKLNKYLNSLYFRHPINNRTMRVYKHKVYIFSGGTLITVFDLPLELYEEEKEQLKKLVNGI